MKAFLNDIPDFFVVEITNRCNLRCPACPWHTCMKRKIHDLTFQEYCVIFEKIAPYASAICFYVMGEPFLNPDWNRIVKFTHERGIKTIISTNGMLLENNIDEIFVSGLDYLQVAIDGNDAMTHESYRVGSDYCKIIASLQKLSTEKGIQNSILPEVVIQTLATRQNESQIEGIQCEMSRLGFGFKLKKMHYGRTRQVVNQNKKIFMPKNEKFIRMEGKNYYTEKLECPEMRQMVILSNGEVVPCCVDFDAKMSMGNIFCDTVEDIWRGERHRAFFENYINNCNTFCEQCDLL